MRSTEECKKVCSSVAKASVVAYNAKSSNTYPTKPNSQGSSGLWRKHGLQDGRTITLIVLERWANFVVWICSILELGKHWRTHLHCSIFGRALSNNGISAIRISNNCWTCTYMPMTLQGTLLACQKFLSKLTQPRSARREAACRTGRWLANTSLAKSSKIQDEWGCYANATIIWNFVQPIGVSKRDGKVSKVFSVLSGKPCTEHIIKRSPQNQAVAHQNLLLLFHLASEKSDHESAIVIGNFHHEEHIQTARGPQSHHCTPLCPRRADSQRSAEGLTWGLSIPGNVILVHLSHTPLNWTEQADSIAVRINSRRSWKTGGSTTRTLEQRWWNRLSVPGQNGVLRIRKAPFELTRSWFLSVTSTSSSNGKICLQRTLSICRVSKTVRGTWYVWKSSADIPTSSLFSSFQRFHARDISSIPNFVGWARYVDSAASSCYWVRQTVLHRCSKPRTGRITVWSRNQSKSRRTLRSS